MSDEQGRTRGREYSPITRRSLLKGAAVATGALAVGPLLQGCGAAGPTTSSSGPIKIGVLVPLAGVYTGLGEDMIQGLELYLESVNNEIAGRKVELVKEDSEAKPDVALTKARKLIEQDKVDLVTGIVSSAVALGLRDLFDSTKNILVISNAGANAVTRDRKSKYIFRTSFSNWQSCFPLGQWAFDNVGKRAFCSAPDYAAGKEDVEAFKESFVKAGGEIVGELFPPLGNNDYQPFITQMQQGAPDLVFSFYSGSDAVRFVQQYEQFGLKGKIPLVGPGFLTETDVLPQQQAAAEGIRTSLHYSHLLDTPENKKFVEAYQGKYNEVPSVFALQSYDAAQLIDAAIKATEGNTSDKDKLVAAMEATTLTSPRGPFRIDPETHNPIMHVYLREVQKVGDGWGNVVIQDLGEFKDPGA